MAIRIGDKLESIAIDHKVAETQNIFDPDKNKYQSEINRNIYEELAVAGKTDNTSIVKSADGTLSIEPKMQQLIKGSLQYRVIKTI